MNIVTFPLQNGIAQAENEARAGEGSSIYDGLSVPDLQKGLPMARENIWLIFGPMITT